MPRELERQARLLLQLSTRDGVVPRHAARRAVVISTRTPPRAARRAVVISTRAPPRAARRAVVISTRTLAAPLAVPLSSRREPLATPHARA
jgi:hypothetical protein